ncbi:MAG: DUF2752 domain-containing protein [Crocosphaera sp.]|nr:DUF2752 domain-containing protein [Crocosphaera sp.]
MLSKKQELSRDLSPQEKNKKIIQLLLLCLPILVSFLSNFGLNIPLPGCPLLYYLGIPCPAWGLTRSFQAITQGNILQGIKFHLFGPILFIIFLSLIFHLIKEILKNKYISNAYIKILRHSTYQTTFLLILFAYHGTRLHNLWKTGELSHAFLHSPLVEWVSTINWLLIKNLLYN